MEKDGASLFPYVIDYLTIPVTLKLLKETFAPFSQNKQHFLNSLSFV